VRRRLLALGLVGGLSFAADQATKLWAVAALKQSCEVLAREGSSPAAIETCDAHDLSLRLAAPARELRIHRGPAAFVTLTCRNRAACLRGEVRVGEPPPDTVVTREERDPMEQALLMLRGVPIEADHLTTGADGQLYRMVVVHPGGAESVTRFRFRSPAKGIEVVSGFARLRYVENPGAAWGLLGGLDDRVRTPLFLAIAFVAIAFLGFVLARAPSDHPMFVHALSLIIGGAAGNLVDRLRQGYVVDFIELHARDAWRWPTFNVADVAISIGVVLLVFDGVRAWWHDRKARRLAARPPDAPSDPNPGEPGSA
jgi:lipoprotein signal peptidase